MKQNSVKEEGCLGCHPCKYNRVFACAGISSIAAALKDKPTYSPIRAEGHKKIAIDFEKLKKVSTAVAFLEKKSRKQLGGVV